MTIVYYCLAIFLFLFLGVNLPKKLQNSLFTLLEFSFFATLIFQQLSLKVQKTAIIILSILFFVYQVIYYINSPKKKFDSIPIGIEAILVFVFIFFFLYEQIRDAKDIPIYENYFFWISIGLFIYLGGSFFIYLMATSMSNAELKRYWGFTYIVEIIKNLLFTLSIIVCSKNPNNKKHKRVIPNLDFM